MPILGIGELDTGGQVSPIRGPNMRVTHGGINDLYNGISNSEAYVRPSPSWVPQGVVAPTKGQIYPSGVR